jgi:hypothetical protein
MFRNTKGGEHLCLAKVTSGSMVQVHVNTVSIVAIYELLCVCVCVCTGRTATRTHTHNSLYIATILTVFTWTCTIKPDVTLARHRCSAPEDGSFVFRNMLGLFLYVILYVFLM